MQKLLKKDSWMGKIAGAFPRLKRKKGSSRLVHKPTVKAYRESHLWCEVCGEFALMGPHHIIFRSQGGSDHWTNLIMLCVGCHEQAHGPDATEWKYKCIGIKDES